MADASYQEGFDDGWRRGQMDLLIRLGATTDEDRPEFERYKKMYGRMYADLAEGD